nr:hypothetical protein [Tanacetum cinerariifolium]
MELILEHTQQGIRDVLLMLEILSRKFFLKLNLSDHRQESHISQLGGSSIDEGTDDEDVDAQDKDRNDDEGDKKDESDDGKDGGGDDEETKSNEESDEEETREEEEESFDPIPRTPEDSEDDGNGEEDQGLRVSEEKRLIEEEEANELYRYVDINQGRGLQLSADIEDSHVTLIPVNPDGQQESSSVSSQFMSSMLNPTSDADRLKSLEVNFSEFIQTNQFAKAVSNIPGIVHQYMTQQMTEAVREAVQIQTDRLRDSYQRENDEFLQTIDDNKKRIIKEQVKIAADLLEKELKKILIENMEGNKSIQGSNEQRNLYNALVDAYEADKTILDSYGETAILKRRREDDDDQERPSAGSDRGSKRRRKGGEPESARAPLEPATRSVGMSTTGSKSQQASASESAFAEEPVQTISQIEEPSHPMFETGAEDQPIVQTSQHPECAQIWISKLVKQADSRSSFNELLDTQIDFSNFIMNQLRVDTLTPELLAGPTYELMRGSCNSLTELEYHLEEVYKAMTDQLDWVNPEGQQYPHNLLQPLQLIPDNRGRRVIPFAHFINNDLEYLRGGADKL